MSLSKLSSVVAERHLRIFLETLPNTVAWDELCARLKKMMILRTVAIGHAGAGDVAAVEKIQSFRPVTQVDLTQPDAAQQLLAQTPHLVIVPRLVAPELDEVKHGVYTDNITTILNHPCAVDTTMPMTARDGVNDVLSPKLYWPSYATVTGTFLRRYTRYFIICDAPPDALVRRLSYTQYLSRYRLPEQAPGVFNITNIHRLRELMLRLAAAHAADQIKQDTLAHPSKYNGSWHHLFWLWRPREALLALLTLSIWLASLGSLYYLDLLSYAGAVVGALVLLFVLLEQLNLGGAIISGVLVSAMVIGLAWPDFHPIAPSPLRLSDMLFVALMLWSGLLAIKIKQLKDHEYKLQELQTKTLLRFVYDAASITTADDLIQSATQNLHQTLGLNIVYLPDAEDFLASQAAKQLAEPDRNAANEALKTQNVVWPAADVEQGYVWCPVAFHEESVGVLGLQQANGTPPDDSYETVVFIRTYARLLAGALWRLILDASEREAAQFANQESLRSSLLASVSHDLKTPLVSIIGTLSLLSFVKDGLPVAERHELILTAHDEAERLHRIVHNVLEMAKLDSGSMLSSRIAVDMMEVFANIMQRFDKKFSRHKLVISNQLTQEPYVFGDELLLSQLFTNLLENAAKYGKPSRPITIEFEQAEAGSMAVRVTNEGPVIPTTEMPYLFDKFFRSRHTDKKTAGSGLGLAICKAIAEVHGGKIAAARVVGRKGGMSFTVTLPLSDVPKLEA